MSWLGSTERELLLAICEAVIPAGERTPGADARTVERIERFLSGLPEAHRSAIRGMLVAIDAASLARSATRFASLPPQPRRALLETLERVDATRLLVHGTLAIVKLHHFATREAQAALGHAAPPPVAGRENPRWLSQIVDAGAQGGDVDLEADVVVVGTGAGGAPVAAELASRGFAVLLLESGRHHDRSELGGAPVEMLRRLYRHAGLTGAVGNTVIPIPVGRTVGGTTTINSGTCFRPPTSVLRGWAARGLVGLSPDRMAPYVDRVWSDLAVGPSTRTAIGDVGRLIARGADALGWSHHPLDRNAPGCDGRGLCCFGCPTGAKRSTDVSYVPRALGLGAQLLTGVDVERVLLERDRAVGVEGRARASDGRSVRVRVRASVVVLSCGALHTPALLAAQGLCDASGELGKNLSIHPATSAVGIMPDAVAGWNAVPQGYCIDEFVGEGMLFEGATTPPELLASVLPGAGPSYVSLVEQASHMLAFGLMIRDESRGRVRAGPGREPVVSYWLGDGDVRRLTRGLARLARVYFAAGAHEVVVPVAGIERLRSVRDVEALEGAHVRARQLDVSAYHPLGTATMGIDPFQSVVGPDHETHDVLDLYVVDGSSVPGPPGVNPQITIMAMALRAAEGIARRLEHRAAA